MAKVLIDSDLLKDLLEGDFLPVKIWYERRKEGRKLLEEPASEELTEDEQDALDDVVADYAFYMRQSCGDNLQPGMPMAAEGRAIKLAESALRKILGDKFGAQAKK